MIVIATYDSKELNIFFMREGSFRSLMREWWMNLKYFVEAYGDDNELWISKIKNTMSDLIFSIDIKWLCYASSNYIKGSADDEW